MSYINHNFLKKDISNLKTNMNDVNIKILEYGEQFKILKGTQKIVSDSMLATREEIEKKVDDSISSMNEMLVDLITDVQSLRRDFDELDFFNKSREDKEAEKELTKKQLQDDSIMKRDTIKLVSAFLKKLNLSQDYTNIVVNLGCKTHSDLILFKEDELLEYGFKLLDVRKILK